MRKLILVFLVGAFPLACSQNSSADQNKNQENPNSAQAVKPCPAGSEFTECQSFLMTLKGKNGHPVNPNNISYIAKGLGILVGDLRIRNYLMLETYQDGGFQVCVDTSANNGFNATVDWLNTFSVGSADSWNVEQMKSCR